ncbi:MAG: hypothetical protein JXR03_18825 [Cyclobacteriaceae bacterium]
MASIKILSAFCAALIGIPVFLITRKTTNDTLLSVLCVSITIFSPELTYFAAQWPKNLLGMAIYLFLIYALLIGNLKLIIGFLIVGFFGHRMTAMLGVITVLVWFMIEKLSRKQTLLLLVTTSSCLVIVLFAPGLITFYDLERLNGFLQWEIQFAPLSFISLFGFKKITMFWLIEMVLMSVFLCYNAYLAIKSLVLKKDSNSLNLVLLIVIAILWFPLFTLDLSGVPYRLYHAGLLLLPLITIPAISDLKKNRILNCCILFGLLATSLISYKSYNPETQDPPYDFYKSITEKIVKSDQPEASPELIIAHKSLAEFITFESSIDAMPWVPEYEIEDDKLYRVAHLPFPKLFLYHTDVVPEKLRGSYYYVKNSEWNVFVKGLIKEETIDLQNQHFDWKNPIRIRPDYLLKNR